MLLSIVVPAYNEAAGIHKFHKELLLPILKNTIRTSYEVVYINDGSKDTTLNELNKLALKDSKVKVVNLSKNFGKEIALTAGIAHAKGDAVMILDSDGQHPPKMIPEFLDKWRNGAQIVVGVRNSNEKEGFIKKWGSKLFYKLFNSTSGAEIVPRSTDFRLIDRVVADEFLRLTERQRISRGLIDWLGFQRDYIYFDSPARIAGEASYKTSQLIKLAMNSFTSLSLKPLFFFGWAGIIITLISLMAGVAIFIEQFMLGDPLELNFTGSALLGIFISFLIGIVLTSQGAIAIYLSHVHGQTQGRPLYIVNPKGSKNLE